MKAIVIVEWQDATMTHHWQDGEFPSAPGSDECLVRSVGFLVHKDRQVLVLLQTTSDNQHANTITIPRGCIRKIEQLWPLPPLAPVPKVETDGSLQSN